MPPAAPTPPGASPTFSKPNSNATWALTVFVFAAVSNTQSSDIPVTFRSRCDGVARFGKRSGIVGYGPKKRSGDLITASFSTSISSIEAEEDSVEILEGVDTGRILGEKPCVDRMRWAKTRNHPAVFIISCETMV
mmetsp:Transcript_24663/g.51620  ORF Transcript_24663/g.51620 Transcript_24663/m.51620 type:complete len:135 (-) Transcript_24663:199-603(-)